MPLIVASPRRSSLFTVSVPVTFSRYAPEEGNAEKFKKEPLPSVRFPVTVPEVPRDREPDSAMQSVPPFMLREEALERITLENCVAVFTVMPDEPPIVRALARVVSC